MSCWFMVVKYELLHFDFREIIFQVEVDLKMNWWGYEERADRIRAKGGG